MRTPLASGPAGDEIEQLSIITPASSARMPFSVDRSTRTWSSMTWSACSMSMPFSPPTTVTCRERDVIGTHDDASTHDSADERLRVADHERALNDAVQMDGRRANDIGGAEPADERRGDRDRGDEPGAAELAAGLAVLEPQAREHAVAEHLSGQPADAVKKQRRVERRGDLERAHADVDEPPARDRRAARPTRPAGRAAARW